VAQPPAAVDAPGTPAPSGEPPLVRAGRVANMVSLDYVRFSHFSANTLDRSKATEAPVASTVGFTRPKIDREDERFLVSSTLVFSLHAETDNNTAIATLRATIELAYVHKKDQPAIADEDLQEFANVNAPFNAWGYWREYVQSSLARLELPAARIPLFRVQTAQRMMLSDTE
jgi:hypothetical protein